ncbi:sugar phosphate isomerase/epimerase [Roseibium sp. RKSG952]|uniref:sugar phosphate isomerase/epimerase family protein n=1 Tax=Roseibium sp. RKSG952 TaxID=2529384 RepID=UPI0012BBED15|nr:sugar phosphate isomerase/epimerase [Roseibium sp. RKSG952]MTI02351.1 sugar phosphate isomerase/epimerase [Roseibium sp. RKSG952]
MRISAQLYTVRQIGDLKAQLELVAGTGFADIETIGFHDLSPSQMVDQVRQSGLNVRSAHFEWWEFESRFQDILFLLRELECHVAVMPWLTPEARPDTVRGWRAVSGQLNIWADQLAVHGVRLAYHNHDFDLEDYQGVTPLGLILEQGNIWWQPDIGWLVAAGLDPAAATMRYGDRIISVHAKDVDPLAGQGDECWRDLGQGVVDWPAVLAALGNTGCTDLFVEHDETLDHWRTMETGRRFLTDQLCEGV